MGSGWGVVLGAPTIMAEHPGIAFGKMLFDYSIPTGFLNHKIGGPNRLPHPLPVLFPSYPGSCFIRSDPGGIHNFLFDRLDDPFGLSLHVRQFVGDGPLCESKPKKVMGDLAE